jgi:iron(III) transport system ATP-binding protein
MQPIWTREDVVVNGITSPRLVCDRLSISAGITAVLGESGAGKSTLLNLLVGFIRPDSGHIQKACPEGDGRLPLFWVPQNEGLWPHLSVGEHLATVQSRAAADVEAELQAMELGGLGSRAVDTLSVGEQSRLAVARTVAADAWVTVMDEPFAHVDRSRRTDLWRRVLKRARAGDASVVFASHSARMVLGHADRAILIREGRVVCEGSVDALYWQPATREIAAALGPVNWLSAGEAALWLPEATEERNYRPCELRLDVVETGGPLQVAEERFCGETTEVTLRHEPTGDQRCFSLMPGSDVMPGACVRLVYVPRSQSGGLS